MTTVLRFVPLSTVVLLLLACGSGTLSGRDGDADQDSDASGCDCTPEQVCRADVCVSADDLCDGVSCGVGARCYLGACIDADPCSGVTCSTAGEVCQNGACVSGAADEDGDNSPAREDCDDSDPLVHPGADELCNGADDDCDDQIDETFDADGDAFPGCEGTMAAIFDCVDTDSHVYPGADERCNGQDDDCDTDVDEGFDGDGDGVFPASCSGHSEVDCDDSEPSTYPGAPEPCDGEDNDCDGAIDEESDGDGDGFPPPGCGTGPEDCDDSNRAIHPGAAEECDGQDNDCDGDVDQAASSSPVCPMCLGDELRAEGSTRRPRSCSELTPCSSCVYFEGQQYFCRSNNGGTYTYVEPDPCTESRRCDTTACNRQRFYCDPDAWTEGAWIPEEELPNDQCDGLDNDCDGRVDSQGGSPTCPMCGDGQTRSVGQTTMPGSCTSRTDCDACLHYNGEEYYCRSNNGGDYQYIPPYECNSSRACHYTSCDQQTYWCDASRGWWVPQGDLPDDDCDGLDNDCDGTADSSAGSPTCPECPTGQRARGLSALPDSCDDSIDCWQCFWYDDAEYYCRSVNGGSYDYVLPDECTPAEAGHYTECDGQCFTCDGAGTWQPGCS